MKIAIGGVVVLALVGGYFWLRASRTSSRSLQVMQWIRDPASHPEWAVQAGQRCADAPFLLPTSGLIGFLWDDSFRPGHRHAGIDIFGGSDPGVTPVYSVYDGYLTRMDDWKSSIIIRIPSDPLNPGQQIWTYYTHLADPDGSSFIVADFPPGTHEVFIPAGTLLGYQGNYSGAPGNPTGVHLHFSVVKDDGSGRFLNELEIVNTLDPSPYLGLPLNAHTNPNQIPLCAPSETEG
ncbi:MAG: M23 family metallopeptidase [Chloroflexi bacterium]|nr:M23 family metallopeptidase [Chloroflexota bacterium]